MCVHVHFILLHAGMHVFMPDNVDDMPVPPLASISEEPCENTTAGSDDPFSIFMLMRDSAATVTATPSNNKTASLHTALLSGRYLFCNACESITVLYT